VRRNQQAFGQCRKAFDLTLCARVKERELQVDSFWSLTV
jgi:hypothetical protein